MQIKNRQLLSILVILLSVAFSSVSATEKKKEEEQDGSHVQPDNLYPVVEMHTNKGVIAVELNRYKAPITVNNFLRYVDKGLFNKTIFHRVAPDFVIQGGGYSAEMEAKVSLGNIFNESGNGLKNEFYTIAMARQNDPHSADRQFFFNMNDNESLDPGRNWGYTVFGMVTEGTEVLDAIMQVETHYLPLERMQHVPVEPIILEKVVLRPPL